MIIYPEIPHNTELLGFLRAFGQSEWSIDKNVIMVVLSQYRKILPEDFCIAGGRSPQAIQKSAGNIFCIVTILP